MRGVVGGGGEKETPFSSQSSQMEISWEARGGYAHIIDWAVHIFEATCVLLADLCPCFSCSTYPARSISMGDSFASIVKYLSRQVCQGCGGGKDSFVIRIMNAFFTHLLSPVRWPARRSGWRWTACGFRLSNRSSAATLAPRPPPHPPRSAAAPRRPAGSRWTPAGWSSGRRRHPLLLLLRRRQPRSCGGRGRRARRRRRLSRRRLRRR